MFEEYQDNRHSINLTIVLCLILLAISIFLNVSATINKEIFNYLLISLFVVLIIAILEFSTDTSFLKANFFGISKENIIFSLFLGLIIGFGLGAIMPNAAVLPLQSIIQESDVNFFLVNIFAPIVEPLFWRGIVATTLISFFIFVFPKNKMLGISVGILIASYIFGFYHVQAYLSQSGYSQDITLAMITFAMIFAVIWFLGINLLKCVAFEIGWHFTNNLYASGFTTGQVFFNSIIFLIVFSSLVYLINKD